MPTFGKPLSQGHINPGGQVALETKFRPVALNICGSSLWNSHNFAYLPPRIPRWLLDCWETCVSALSSHHETEN